jgi:hypothetical protein
MAPPFRQRQDDSQPFIDNLVNLMLTWRCPRQFQSKRSERSPDGAERNPGRHRRLVAIPDYAALHPGYASLMALIAHAKIDFCESFPRIQIDFRSLSHRVSKPLRSNVSRQQSRRFNDLQGATSLNSATAFDNRRRIRLKAKYLAL